MGVEISDSPSSGHVLQNLRLDSNFKVGIYVWGDGIKISDNVVVNTSGGTIYGNTMGILFTSGNGAVIANNPILNTGDESSYAIGIRQFSYSGARIINNTIANPVVLTLSNYAIQVYVDSSSGVIINNDMHNYKYGVYVLYAMDTIKCFNNFTTGVLYSFTGCRCE